MKLLWEEFLVNVLSALPGAGPEAEKFTVSFCGLCANNLSHPRPN